MIKCPSQRIGTKIFAVYFGKVLRDVLPLLLAEFSDGKGSAVGCKCHRQLSQASHPQWVSWASHASLMFTPKRRVDDDTDPSLNCWCHWLQFPPIAARTLSSSCRGTQTQAALQMKFLDGWGAEKFVHDGTFQNVLLYRYYITVDVRSFMMFHADAPDVYVKLDQKPCVDLEDAVTLNSLISCCGRAEAWQEAGVFFLVECGVGMCFL